MKKFYAIALASLVALSAAAERQHLASGVNLQKTKKTTVAAIKTDSRVKARPSLRKVGALKANDRTTLADYTGEYTFTGQSLLKNQAGQVSPAPAKWVATISDESTNELALTFEIDRAYTIKAVVDITAGTFSIANDQFLGPDSYGDQMWLYFKDVTNEGYLADGKNSQTASVGQISGNTITFPEMDVWIVGDYNNEDDGFWMATAYNGFNLPKINSGGGSGVSGDLAKYEGTYILSANSLIQNPVPSEWVVTVTDEATGELSIATDAFGAIWSIKAFVNIAEGTFSIPNDQYLGRDSYGDQNWFYLKDVASDGNTIEDGKSNLAATVGVISGNTITFPELDIWAIGDYNDENLGWWMLTYANVFTIEGAEEEGNWIDYGTATFEDGWMLPGMEESGADYPWTVTVQQSEDNVNLFRLQDPYIASDCPIAQYGGAGQIVFDVADPTFVKVLPDFFSGIVNGSAKLYFFNLEGLFSSMGYDKATIQSELGSSVDAWSTFENGVVNIENCRFDVNRPNTKAYVWSNDADESLAYLMHGRIIFDSSKVSTLAADAVEGVEFFNLQGQRIVNPEAGQLVIKRTANGTIKTIIR